MKSRGRKYTGRHPNDERPLKRRLSQAKPAILARGVNRPVVMIYFPSGSDPVYGAIPWSLEQRIMKYWYRNR